MAISARILRNQADDLARHRVHRTTRDLEREDRILSAAKPIFAQHGRAAITFSAFAAALRMSTATLRRHFVDLDSILFELLMRHLHAIAEAVGKIPTDTPNIQAARRAAYLAFTRTGYGAPTEAHLLLIRERHGLPEDLADPIEAMRQSLGVLLAGAGASAALALLDIQDLQAPHIEAMLAAAAQVEATQSEIAHLATAPCATIQPETAPPAEAQPALAAGLPQQVASETPPPAGGTSCDVDHLRQLLARSFPGLADPLIAAAKHRPIPGEPPGIWPEKSIRARAGPLLAGSAL